jgi:hypothetical protein
MARIGKRSSYLNDLPSNVSSLARDCDVKAVRPVSVLRLCRKHTWPFRVVMPMARNSNSSNAQRYRHLGDCALAAPNRSLKCTRSA